MAKEIPDVLTEVDICIFNGPIGIVMQMCPDTDVMGWVHDVKEAAGGCMIGAHKDLCVPQVSALANQLCKGSGSNRASSAGAQYGELQDGDDLPDAWWVARFEAAGICIFKHGDKKR